MQICVKQQIGLLYMRKLQVTSWMKEYTYTQVQKKSEREKE